MEAALRLSDDISEDSILAMHKALMLHQRGFEKDAGHYRSEQVWIGRGEAGPRLAEFVAPDHDRIPGAIADLVGFVKREDISVLVQVAVRTPNSRPSTRFPMATAGRGARSPSRSSATRDSSGRPLCRSRPGSSSTSTATSRR